MMLRNTPGNSPQVSEGNLIVSESERITPLLINIFYYNKLVIFFKIM